MPAMSSLGGHPLDRILIPAKRFVYKGLCGGDYARYLALRATAASTAGKVGLYERETTRAVRTIVGKGDVAIDVGASFGVYTALLAKLVGPSGRVDAFEPQSDVFAHLRKRFAGVTQVNLEHAGVADNSGVGHMIVPSLAGGIPETALASLHSAEGAVLGTETVPVVTLDEHCRDLASLRFLKVDVEGGDLAVLRGGRQTIARLRPVIQFECNDAALLPQFAAFAGEVGYRIAPEVYDGVNRFLRPSI
jgi:FkbM family methyltransferase